MRSWIELLARVGYAARGVVYLIVGSLAVLAALGRSQAQGTKGAIESLLGQPFGEELALCYEEDKLYQELSLPDLLPCPLRRRYARRHAPAAPKFAEDSSGLP